MGIIEDRWEKGTDHHPLAVDIVKGMAKLDTDDECFGGLKFGGDGDNGEDLLFLMSAWMEKEGVTGLMKVKGKKKR